MSRVPVVEERGEELPPAEVPEEFGGREDELAELEAFANGGIARDAVEELSAELRMRFREAAEARREIDAEMLECKYQRDGVYSPDVAASLEAQGGSQAFDNITEEKCASVQAEIVTHVLYGPKRVWDISPTPVPELDGESYAAAADAAAREAVAAGTEVSEADLERAIQREADRASARMTKVVEDLLAEGGWMQAFKAFAYNVVTFPVAGLLGPVPKKQLRVVGHPGGRVETRVEFAMSVEAVDPFGVFPAAMSGAARDGDFFYRRLLGDDQARELGQLGNLLPGAFEKAYAAKGGGVADTGLDQAIAAHEKNLGKAGDTHNPDGKHELVMWWHSMTLGEMRGVKREEPEEGEDVEERVPCMGLMLNGTVITAERNWDPRGIPQVHLCSWRQTPGTVFGKGVAQLIKDAQNNMNVARRAINNNIHMSSQNQRIAWPDLLMNPVDSLRNNYPGQTFVARLSGTPGDTRKPIEPVATPNITSPLLGVLQQTKQSSDDKSGSYPVQIGDNRHNPAAQTLGGMELQREDQSKLTKLSLANIDECIQEMIEQFRLWVLLVDGHEDAKGDQKVVSTGTRTLFERSDKHERAQSTLEMMKDPSWQGRWKENAPSVMLRELVELRDQPSDKLLKTDDELANDMAAGMPEAPPSDEGRVTSDEMGGMPVEAGGPPALPEGEMPEGEPPLEESPEMVRARADMIRAEAAAEKVRIEAEKLVIEKAKAVQMLRERNRGEAARRAAAAQAGGGMWS